MDKSALRKSKRGRLQAVTIRDVAGHAGVAPMTVSCVLNGTGRISEGTRATVRKAIQELGYEPNLNAQRLAGARDERTVALLLPKLYFDVTLRKVVIMQKLLSQLGYSVPMHASGALAVTEDDDKELRVVARELRRQKPRAIVCRFGALSLGAQDEVRRYQQEGGLVVSFNDPGDLECDEVLFDREHNTYESARYLLELGHRDIGMWMTNHDVPLLSPRTHGFRRALHEFGVPERPEWQLHSGDFSCNEESGAELAERMLAMKERPTAMCVVNDSAAQAFVAELQRGGVRVPEDMSVISHDDLPIARFGAVPLTAMSHPIEETAHTVFDLLRERIENNYDGPPRRIVLRGELHVRQSTAPPRN